MRSDFVDLTGKTFGRWTVLGFAGKNRHGQPLWECKCSCGTLRKVRGMGRIASRSCGCLQRERTSEISSRHNTTHGQSRTPLYQVWAAVKRRCRNSNVVEYPLYGGRGIDVCPEWERFEAFRDWALSNGYQADMTIDRIDPNGNYEPQNCRWITMAEQQRNRRDNIWIEVHGKKVLLADIARSTGILDKTLYSRYKRGARTYEELTKPTDTRIYVEYEGKRMSLRELAALFDLNYGTVWKRYNRGERSIDGLTRRA